MYKNVTAKAGLSHRW